MSKRKDLDAAWRPSGERDSIEAAWDLGRVAGLREAAKLVDSPNASDGPTLAMILRYEARRLKRRLGK
jgi:hypothetical protein